MQFERLDAAESAHFQRQLEYIAARSYDVKYAELKGRMLVPLNSEVPEAARLYTYEQYDFRGMAKIVSNYAADLPRVDVFGVDFSAPIRTLGDSFSYTIDEIRASAMSGADLNSRKATAARRVIEQKLDSIIQSGDSAHGLLGLFNQPNAIDYTIPNGAAGATEWESKTADEILADLSGIVTAIVNTTKEVEAPNTILLPTAHYELIANKRLGDGSDKTVLAHFLGTNAHITEVMSWYALAGAGDGGADLMVCYKRDPETLSLIVPQDFRQEPPERRNLSYVINCTLKTAGVVAHYPLGIAYGAGI